MPILFVLSFVMLFRLYTIRDLLCPTIPSSISSIIRPTIRSAILSTISFIISIIIRYTQGEICPQKAKGGQLSGAAGAEV